MLKDAATVVEAEEKGLCAWRTKDGREEEEKELLTHLQAFCYRKQGNFGLIAAAPTNTDAHNTLMNTFIVTQDFYSHASMTMLSA